VFPTRVPNPVRWLLRVIAALLVRLDLIDDERARRTTDLAWPRIVTGMARMSKGAADVAMVGVAVGPAAIAGVGYATPFWVLVFTVGAGLAGGTIALVSQRYGAGADEQLGQAVRSSVLLLLVVTLPLAATFGLAPRTLIGLLTSDPDALRLGARYLRILALGVPFAGLALIGSRVLVGADDARIPMWLRVGGAGLNVGVNATLIFGLGLGVAGAAIGTVLANVVVAGAFAVGIVRGRLPGIGEVPVRISPWGTYVHRGTVRDLVRIGAPVIGRNAIGTTARFPLLAIVGLYGQPVVAAYVISRRVWDVMNVPGWGFRLAASSLVGQSLGAGDEAGARGYAMEMTRFSVATYALSALLVFLAADPIVGLFLDDPTSATRPIAVTLVVAACIAVLPSGVRSVMDGALTATGDTRWPLYGRALGTWGVVLPLAYLGSVTRLGLPGLGLAYVAWTAVPAAVNYYRFAGGHWRAISRDYRPSSVDD
jgi:putative MATE family efflux protein